MKIDITVNGLSIEAAQRLTDFLAATTEAPVHSAQRFETKEADVIKREAVASAPCAFEAQNNLTAADDDNTAPLVPVPAGELDARGFPWNEKIHSGSQKKNADGTWAKRRGTSNEVIEAVEIEMRGAGFGQPSAPALPVANVIQPVALPQQPVLQQPVQQVAVAPAQVHQPVYQAPAAMQPAYQAPAVQQPVHQAPAMARDFQGLSLTIGQLFQAGQATPEYLDSLCARIGQQFQVQVNAITDIQAQPPMIEFAFALLAQDGKIAG